VLMMNASLAHVHVTNMNNLKHAISDLP